MIAYTAILPLRNNHCVNLGHMYCTLWYIDKTSTLAFVDPGRSCAKANFDECLCPPFSLPAEDILDLVRKQFLKDVDAQAVVGELRQNGIVPQSCQEKVAKADGFRQRNEILHDCLKRTCTREALIKACDIIIELAEGGEENNPKMKKVGEDMKMKLGTGKTTCALFRLCVLHARPHTLYAATYVRITGIHCIFLLNVSLEGK